MKNASQKHIKGCVPNQIQKTLRSLECIMQKAVKMADLLIRARENLKLKLEDKTAKNYDLETSIDQINPLTRETSPRHTRNLILKSINPRRHLQSNFK